MHGNTKLKFSDYYLRQVCLSVCLRVCPSAWNKPAPTAWIFIKSDIGYFQKPVEKIPFPFKSDKNSGYFT